MLAASRSRTSAASSRKPWAACAASWPRWWIAMPVRDVLRMGHPVLRQRAKPVEAFGTPELKQLVQDMVETMESKSGAGLAAPQIGVSQRIVIFGVEHNPRYPEAEPVPFTVLVNPKLVMLTREVEEDWEGCLSVP